MLANRLKSALIATATAAALFVGLGVSPAAAVQFPFTIAPTGIPGVTGLPSFTATDVQGVSDALIQQTGANTQTETGWVVLNAMSNAGTFLGSGITGLQSKYELYILFQGVVNNCSFASCSAGTIAPGAFNFELVAEEGTSLTASPGGTNSTSGVAPTLSTGLDSTVVLAVGTSLAGGASLQNATGGPTLNATSLFYLCDGTANQGLLGGVATSTPLVPGGPTCGAFDARAYFTAPNPFYSINFTSDTAGSINDLSAVANQFNDTCTLPAGCANATLNNVVVDANFLSVPEPATLGMFGMGLIGLGFMFRGKKESRT